MKLPSPTKLTLAATACLSLGLYIAANAQDTSHGGGHGEKSSRHAGWLTWFNTPGPPLWLGSRPA